MSTDEILEALCHAKLLYRWEPKYEGREAPLRRIYVTREVRDWLLGPSGGAPAGGAGLRVYRDALAYAVDVRRFLKGFVVGELFDDDDKLKNLDRVDAGRWAIRIKRRPQSRLFGGFPQPNIFVASHFEPREVMDNDTSDWSVQKARISKFWSTLSVDVKDDEGNPCKVNLSLSVGLPRSTLVSAVKHQ